MGMAIAYNGELCDFRVRTFYGKWTEEKRRGMVANIERAIERYGITRLAVKTPKPAHCTQRIRDLISDIERLSEQRHIKLSVCTISALKRQYNGQISGNKQALIRAIIEKYPQYPQLAEIYSKERSNHNAYYVKLFEAIACAELA